VYPLDNFHHDAFHHLKEGSYSIRACYDLLANSAGFQEQGEVCLYRLTLTRRKSPILQPSRDGPYKVITRMNDMVNSIQLHPKAKMMVVHLDRLAPCLGATLEEHP
jgi:hypothetical protein